ncbi:MAG: hypothetical protein WCG66_02795 [bacterium]
MRLFPRLALLLLPLLLGACRFENPLTSSPSEALNTWLLGEWELKEKGGVSSAVVSPLPNDRYSIHVSLSPQAAKGRRDYDFEAWASRVGNSTFFTLRNLRNAPDLPEGAHVFLHAQMIDQVTVRLRSLQLDSPDNATSQELRKEIRTRLKEGSLYKESKDWRRVAEIYWTKEGETGLFKPLRFAVPTSTDQP